MNLRTIATLGCLATLFLFSCGAPYPDEPNNNNNSEENEEQPLVTDSITETTPKDTIPVIDIDDDEDKELSVYDYTDFSLWQGNKDKFRVREPEPDITPFTWLCLNDINTTTKSTAYISAPSTVLRGGQWSFEFLVNGKAISATSQARFYLASDNSDLTAPLKGYFLAFGISNERLTGDKGQFLALCRQDGTLRDTTIIFDCHKNVLLSAATEISVNISCDNNGLWQMQARLAGTPYTLWGKAIDNTHTTSKYLGIQANYTKSNSTNYAFGNIKVSQRKP